MGLLKSEPRASYDLEPFGEEEFRFVLRSADGRVLLLGEPHPTQAHAEKALEVLRTCATDDRYFERRRSLAAHTLYFVIRGPDSEVIARGGVQLTDDALEYCVNEIKECSPGAWVDLGT